MNEIDPSKYKSIINKSKPKRNYFKGLLTRLLLAVILFLTLAIIYKSNKNFKNYLDKHLFNNNISFTKIKKVYNKYLGGVLPKLKEDNTILVSSEKIAYKDIENYYDGIDLKVEAYYLVPSLEEGMVVFIGDKEHYGNTIIVEDLNGIHYWYGNITNSSLKLYDYIEKAATIGEVSNDLYLVFSKDDKYLNYEEYLK